MLHPGMTLLGIVLTPILVLGALSVLLGSVLFLFSRDAYPNPGGLFVVAGIGCVLAALCTGGMFTPTSNDTPIDGSVKYEAGERNGLVALGSPSEKTSAKTVHAPFVTVVETSERSVVRYMITEDDGAIVAREVSLDDAAIYEDAKDPFVQESTKVWQTKSLLQKDPVQFRAKSPRIEFHIPKGSVARETSVSLN